MVRHPRGRCERVHDISRDGAGQPELVGGHGGVAGAGYRLGLRHHRLCVCLDLPAHAADLGPRLVAARRLSVCRRGCDDLGVGAEVTEELERRATTLAATLRESKMMPEGLRNRIDVLFDPDHAGWFNSVQAVKDVTLALELAQGGAPLPVTEAARDAYRQVVQDGWQTHDVTTLVEYGRLAGLAGAAALSRKTTIRDGPHSTTYTSVPTVPVGG